MNKFSFNILLIILLLSCSTKKQIVHSSYSAEITAHRSHYKADFIKDENSPLKKEDLEHLHFYPADESFKCDCDFQLTPDSKPFELSTYSGMTKPYRQYGIANCLIHKKETKVHFYASLRIQAMPGYRDHLFLPFKDLTNGEETYGGGRYIDMKTGDIQDGRVIIDFNKCYNPWCAYSDGYNCPIPPIENHLDLEIKVGEKMWTGEKKKS